MRHLLHLGLFALVLTAATQADAQGRQHGDRRTVIAIAPSGVPSRAQPVHTVSRYASRQAYLDPQRDLIEIRSIAQRWERASARNDRRAQSIADCQLEAWLDREIRESIRQPDDYGHVRHLRALSNELAVLERRPHHGRGHRGYYAEKTRILDELVAMSERQVQRAQAGVHPWIRLSFSRR